MAMQISAIAEMGRCTLTTASAAPASATPTTSTSAASASAVGWTRARGSFRRGGRAAWRLERCAVVARRWGRCWRQGEHHESMGHLHFSSCSTTPPPNPASNGAVNSPVNGLPATLRQP